MFRLDGFESDSTNKFDFGLYGEHRLNSSTIRYTNRSFSVLYADILHSDDNLFKLRVKWKIALAKLDIQLFRSFIE